MLEFRDVGILMRNYLIQASSIVFTLTVLVAVVANIFSFQGLSMPTIVSVCFSLVVTFTDGLIWRRIAKYSPDSLPTFYTALSGFRMLLALFTLFICYVVVGRDEMTEYCVVFMAYYFVILIHHSVFFSRVSNSHSKCDKEK